MQYDICESIHVIRKQSARPTAQIKDDLSTPRKPPISILLVLLLPELTNLQFLESLLHYFWKPLDIQLMELFVIVHPHSAVDVARVQLLNTLPCFLFPYLLLNFRINIFWISYDLFELLFLTARRGR